MDFKRAFMRHHSCVPSGSQPGRQHIFSSRGWVVAQAIEATTQADKATTSSVIGKEWPTIAKGMSLSGCEVTGLLGSKREKVFLTWCMRYCVMHTLNNTEVLHDSRIHSSHLCRCLTE